MAARATIKSVNEELARLGHKATLAKGGDYFYFQGPDADDWLDRTVRAPTLSTYSIEQWIGEFERLRKLNSDLFRSAGTTRRRPKR